MAIFNPGAPKPADTPITTRVNDGHQTATVDTKRIPLQQLVTHVQGYGWTVEYFHQILGRDDAPKPHEPTLDPTLQQYERIEQFELRVTDPLSYEYIKERDTNVLEGTAAIYPGTITPQRGDMFIADIGNGASGIFTLTDVTSMSYLMEKTYEVRYRLTSETTDGMRLTDLRRKVVRESQFVKDFLMHGQNPILSKANVSYKQQLDLMGYRLVDRFIQDFATSKERYLLVPGQPTPTYDYFLAAFLNKFLNASQHRRLRDLKVPPMDEIPEMRVETLWDAVLKQQPTDAQALSNYLSLRMGVVDTWVIKNTPFFNSLYYSTVYRLIWPSESLEAYVDHTLEVTGDRDYFTPPAPPQPPTTPPVDPNAPPEPPGVDKPNIHPINKDAFYVLSQAFYENDPETQSLLEYLISQMLKRNRIPEQQLLSLCEDAFTWPDLERFYYIPLLMVLINYSVRSL